MFRRLPGQAEDCRLKNHAPEQTEPTGRAHICGRLYQRHFCNTAHNQDRSLRVAIQSSIDSSVSSRVLTPRFQISTVGETVVRDLAYLQAEFPTEWPRLPNICSTVTHSLAKFFVSKLPEDPRIERVYWAFEGAVL